MNFLKESFDSFKKAVREPAGYAYFKYIIRASLIALFLSTIITIVVTPFAIKILQELNNYLLEDQSDLIKSIRELDEENTARKRNIKRLEGLCDAETDEKEKASIQKDIDLANEDLAKKEQERDAIASKVTDKAAIDKE